VSCEQFTRIPLQPSSLSHHPSTTIAMAELIDVVTGQPVKFSCLTDLPERQQFRTVNGEFVCRLTPTLVQFGGTRLFQSLNLSISLCVCHGSLCVLCGLNG
jgi:hypothetical protein